MMLGDPDDRPWSACAPELAAVVRPEIPAIIESAIRRISTGQLGVAGDGGQAGLAIRTGIGHALHHLCDLLGRDAPALDAGLSGQYAFFGAREQRQGRTIDSLLAAYQIGARVTWSRVSAAAIDADVGVEQLARLATAIFTYVDELGAASASGFAQAHAEQAGRRDVVRATLVTALVDGLARSSPARIDRLAVEADWSIPERLAIVLVGSAAPGDPGTAMGPTTVRPPRQAPIPPPDVLVGAVQEDRLFVVPVAAAGTVGDRVGALLPPGAVGYVGTVRPAWEGDISLTHARAVQHLVLTGVLPAERVVEAGDHLPELLLHADAQLLDDLCTSALAPFAALPTLRRDTYLETLRVWLLSLGDRRATAAALGIHPQTVSYRLRRLDDVAADAVRDPEARFQLLLALHRHTDRG